MRIAALRKACKAMKATRGLAKEVAAIGGTPEENAAIESAMTRMLMAVHFETDARLALTNANFRPRTITRIIKTMRIGLGDGFTLP